MSIFTDIGNFLKQEKNLVEDHVLDPTAKFYLKNIAPVLDAVKPVALQTALSPYYLGRGAVQLIDSGVKAAIDEVPRIPSDIADLGHTIGTLSQAAEYEFHSKVEPVFSALTHGENVSDAFASSVANEIKEDIIGSGVASKDAAVGLIKDGIKKAEELKDTLYHFFTDSDPVIDFVSTLFNVKLTPIDKIFLVAETTLLSFAGILATALLMPPATPVVVSLIVVPIVGTIEGTLGGLALGSGLATLRKVTGKAEELEHFLTMDEIKASDKRLATAMEKQNIETAFKLNTTKEEELYRNYILSKNPNPKEFLDMIKHLRSINSPHDKIIFKRVYKDHSGNYITDSKVSSAQAFSKSFDALVHREKLT